MKIPLVLACLVIVPLSSCSISTPFKSPDGNKDININADQYYIVAITYTHMHKRRSLFWSHVEGVEKELINHEGLIVYSKRKRILGDESWSITIWPNEASLRQFSQSYRHQLAIEKAYKSLTAVLFVQPRLQGNALSPTWDNALNALAMQNTD